MGVMEHGSGWFVEHRDDDGGGKWEGKVLKGRERGRECLWELGNCGHCV